MSNPTANASTTPITPTSITPTSGGKPRWYRRAIEQRRNGVWEMLCCGQSVDDIANRFKVSTKTIQRDLDWWEKRLGQDTEDLKRDPKQAAMDVGMTAKRLMKLAEDAYVEHVACSNGAFKARFLQVSGNMLVYRHKVLADAGYLPKVGHEKESAPKVTINFAARYGPEAAVFEDPKSRRRVTDAFLSMIKTEGLADKETLGLPMNPSHVDAPAPTSDEALQLADLDDSADIVAE